MEIIIEANDATGAGYQLRLVMEGKAYCYNRYSMTEEEAEEYRQFLTDVYEG